MLLFDHNWLQDQLDFKMKPKLCHDGVICDVVPEYPLDLLVEADGVLLKVGLLI